MKVMIYIAIAIKFSAFLIPWLFSFVKLLPIMRRSNSVIQVFASFGFSIALAMAITFALAWSAPERALVSSL